MDIRIEMADGIVTWATLHSPRTDAEAPADDSAGTPCELPRLPVVLVRTPYSRRNLNSWGTIYAERGYHLVAQDTRGRFSSTGEFFPMLAEARDGEDTIAWIAKQPWCDGNVAITGVSYLGMSALAAVRNGSHPALKAVAPVLAATDMYNVIYGRAEHTRGVPFIGLVYRWSYLVLNLMCSTWGGIKSIFTFFLRDGQVLRDAYLHTPIVEVDRQLVPQAAETGGLPWLQKGLRNPKGDEPYWKDIRKCVDLEAVVRSHDAWEECSSHPGPNPHRLPPMLLISGWYDFFCPEQIQDFLNLQRVSPETRLIVGPWTHWHVLAMAPKMHRSLLQFFDRHLRSRRTKAVGSASQEEAPDLPLVDAFVYGKNKWQSYRQWPPPQARRVDFLLTRGGSLHRFDEACVSDSDLSVSRRGCDVVSYLYDPHNPTPQIGGQTFNPSNCGRQDQRVLEERGDVLIFTTAPFSHDLTVAGAAKATLIVRSDALATDFVVRLCHVCAGSGRSENIAEGIRRVHDFRSEAIVQCDCADDRDRDCTDDRDRRSFYKIEVFLSPILNRIHAGDSLRMQVTSCAFPTRGRHLNTAHAPFHLALEEHARVASQEILVRGESCGVGSRVSVPILND